MNLQASAQWLYLADEPGNEQKDQNTVVIAAVTKEGVRHEGGEERYLSVGLSHLHFPQLHLNGLGTQIISIKPYRCKSSQLLSVIIPGTITS